MRPRPPFPPRCLPPPSNFKFPPFDGTECKRVAFNRNVTQSLEMPCFAPGSDELVTTTSNAVQSAQLRNALFAALSKAAENHFDDRNNLKFRGIEMVAIIRESYAPTGDNAIFPNFHTLFSLEQGSKEELSTYMARIRTINSKLKAGGVELPRILLNMFTVQGNWWVLRNCEEGLRPRQQPFLHPRH